MRKRNKDVRNEGKFSNKMENPLNVRKLSKVKNSFNGRKFPQWKKTYSMGEDDKT